MLQLHSVTEVSSGILILNLKEPQWQLPLYVLSSTVVFGSAIEFLRVIRGMICLFTLFAHKQCALVFVDMSLFVAFRQPLH